MTQVMAQNPTLVYGTNGVSVLPAGQHAGKIYVGVDPTGANVNDVLTWNGTTWGPAAGGGGGVTLSNLDSNIPVLRQSGATLLQRGLAAGSNITLTTNATTITIASTGGGGSGTVTNIIGTSPINSVLSAAGAVFTVSFDGTTNFNASGATNLNASSLASGTVAYARLPTGTATGLVAGTGITITPASGTYTIAQDGSQVSTNNAVFLGALTNVVTSGSGTSLVSSIASRIVTLKSLAQGSGVTITGDANTITIGASGVTGVGFLASNQTWTASNTWNGASTFNGPFTVTNMTILADGLTVSNNATVVGTTTLDGAVNATNNVTLGGSAANVVVHNASFISAPNGLFITNITALGFNTNSLPSANVVIQGTGLTNLILKLAPAQVPPALQVINSTPTQVFAIRASGQVDASVAVTIGVGSYAAASMSPSAGGADVPIINNSATANSTISLRGGSGTGSAVIMRADNSAEIARFTTNGFGIYTNTPAAALHVRGASILGALGSIVTNHITVAATINPGVIAAGGVFTNDFACNGALLYSACIPRTPPGNSLSLNYQATVYSNNTVTLFIINRNLVSSITASNDTYGVDVITH